MTLNINGRVLPEDFASILGVAAPGGDTADCLTQRQDHTSSDHASHGVLPELIVFNFQEHVKLDFKHVAKDLFSSSNETHHCRLLHDSLTASLPPGYGELASEVMLGLYIIVFAKDEILADVSDVRTAVVARGRAGLKNKGACAISFHHPVGTFCFTNVHSAAADDNVARRNADIHAVTTELKLKRHRSHHRVAHHDRRRRDTVGSRSSIGSDSTQSSFGVAGDHDEHVEGELQRKACIEQADYLFVAGDLNYRLDLDHSQVMAAIGRRDWPYLLDHDQLKIEQAAERIFTGYSEADICFRPTYKFDDCERRDRHYDTSPKKRTPAYTDRVLWRSDRPVRVVSYTSHEDVIVSDHLPVSLTCEV